VAKGLLLGLDIGSSSIKVCQLREQRKSYALQNFGSIALPPEAIVDGSIMNATAVVDGIRELLANQNIKAKNVAISVSGYQVILRKINMPIMSREELEANIQWEAEQYIPFDIKDVNIDVEILNAQNDQGQMDVLLVAAKKDIINDYVNVVREAGLNASVVDVDSFALQNAFEANYSTPAGETIALINVGAAVVNINIIRSNASAFTRDVNQGGNQFTDEIQKQLNVSHDEAETLKTGGGGRESDSVVPQEVERVLQQVSESIANDVQRSLDFYAATAADATINRIYLSGGCAKVSALSRAIEQKTSVPVDTLDPFRQVDVSKGFDPAFLREHAAIAPVSVGLALRAANER
jgi:type IV pilus assembly protein PilM